MSVNGSGPLRVIPLGGLGEIGLNSLVLEYGEAAVLIDCGLMFPEPHMLGVDILIPEFSYLRSLGDRLLGIVVTHGHEDHIGALPYVLRELDVPVYAPPMAAGLVAAKLREHQLTDRRVHVIRPGTSWTMGPFTIDPVHMTHSIVDALGLVFTTPLGVVVHTGDFKIDQTPIDGRPSELEKLAEYGNRGVLLLLSDSTNVEREGFTPTERSVHAGLERIFHDTGGRIFFSTFSSHVHRIRQVLELASTYGRRVAVVGRSLETSVALATDLGHLPAVPGLYAGVDELASLPAEKVTLLTSGSQGEALSALARISMNDHRQVHMEPGDSVVLSSKFIPGNERVIGNMINHMCRRGARVYHHKVAPVHVSGHASQEELKLILRLTRPRYFVPVHGEYRHLVRHRALAWEVGVPPENTFVIEDGQVIEIDPDGARLGGTVTAGRVFVDGKVVGDIGDVILRDRRHLSQDGFVLAVLGINQQTGEVVSGPDLISRGFLMEEANQEHLERAKSLILERLQQIAPESRTDSFEVKEEVRKALKRYFSKTLERRPVILPFIMEM